MRRAATAMPLRSSFRSESPRAPPIQIIGSCCSDASTGATKAASRQTASGVPSSDTRAPSATCSRRIGHHWKYVPSSPAGRSPASRARSAVHSAARSSSSVPASRPRMPSPASANRSRRSTAVSMAANAGGASGV